MKHSNYNLQLEAADQSYVIMLAQILIVAMEDFAALGMEDLTLLLREGIKEIMDKYELKPEDVRVTRTGQTH
jgi:hypothetical protein